MSLTLPLTRYSTANFMHIRSRGHTAGISASNLYYRPKVWCVSKYCGTAVLRSSGINGRRGGHNTRGSRLPGVHRTSFLVSPSNPEIFFFFFLFFFFVFHWQYSPLWALSCRTMSFHFFLSATNTLHLLTPSTWRSLSTSSFHLFLGFPLLLVPSSSWVKIFLGTLSSSFLSRWPNQLILYPFIHFTIFSLSLISSSSRPIRLLHSPA